MTVHTQGQAPARSRRRTHVPEPYDFRRPMTMAREHARVLEMAFETFARQWGNQLTARLRAMAQVTLDGLSLIVVEADNSLAGTIDLRFDFGPSHRLGGNGFFLLGSAVMIVNVQSQNSNLGQFDGMNAMEFGVAESRKYYDTTKLKTAGR